jgi:hypothetical protein
MQQKYDLLQFSKWETHIHDISKTYVSFPHLFAKGKSIQSVGIDMPQDIYKGQHGKWAPCKTNNWITY